MVSLALVVLAPRANAQAYPFSEQVDAYFDLTYAHAVADLDGDGDLDLVVSHFDSVVWFENAGDGREWFEHGLGSQSLVDIVVEDLDADGDPDIIGAGDSVLIYENTAGGGLFTEHDLGGGQIANIGVGDVDGDGFIDVVAVDHSSDQISWHAGTGPLDGFGPPARVAAPPRLGGGSAMFVHDFDGNGSVEIWAMQPEFDYEFFAIYTHDGGPFAEELRPSSEWAHIPRVHDPRDLDGDGDDDMIVGTATRIEQWENRQGVVVLDAVIVDTSPGWTSPSPSIGDVDLDGDLDLVVGSSLGSFVEYWENEGGAYVGPTVISTDNASSSAFTDLVDLDCDGDLDFVVTAEFETVEIFMNDTVPGPSSCDGPAPGSTNPTGPTNPTDPVDPGADDGSLGAEGLCSTGSGSAGWLGLVVVPLLWTRRRRDR